MLDEREVRVINGFEKARRNAHLTQTDVAKVMNVTQGTVSQWESGNCYPTGGKLAALAELYGCTIDYLFRKEENA